MRKKTKLFDNLASTVGNTPLVRLNRLVGSQDAEVYVKLEFFNPGGSIKDRVAFGMIEAAERAGRLKKGDTIVESSSGNTAIGLAIAGAIRGYKVVAVCDQWLPLTKRWKLWSLGADIAFLWKTPKGFDTVQLRIDMATKIAARLRRGITLNQYNNLVNRETHYRSTGQEILRDTNGKLDMVLCAVGTAGTVSGIGRAIKEKNPRIRVGGVEPVGSIIFGGKPGNYLTQGGGLSFIPKNLDRSVIDLGIKVSDKNAFMMCHLMAQKEGIFVGGSSGAVVFAAVQQARILGKGKRIIAVLPDGGERYLDTVYNESWLKKNRVYSRGVARKSDRKLVQVLKTIGCTLNEF